MDNTDTILECGLGFTCDFDKPQGFIGQEHVVAQKAASKAQGGLYKRMASVFVEDPEPLLCHGEVIWRDGKRVSDVRAGSYGHSLGGAVGLTMLESSNGEPITKSYIKNGEWEIEIAGERYPCKISFASFYDPKNTKIKV